VDWETLLSFVQGRPALSQRALWQKRPKPRFSSSDNGLWNLRLIIPVFEQTGLFDVKPTHALARKTGLFPLIEGIVTVLNFSSA
jgi:hypothetical protein